jgi:chromosome segregation ATPase
MVQQRIEALEKQYHTLSVQVERLIEQEKKHDFTIRDSSVKIGISQGLAEKTYKKITELELKLNELQAEMKELRESNDQQFESINSKLDRQEIMTRENSDMLRQLLARIPE